MDIRIPIEEAGDEFAHARRMLAAGTVQRGDRLIYTRSGKDAIYAPAGWWADHMVREDAARGPEFVRWKPFPMSRRRPETASDLSEAE